MRILNNQNTDNLIINDKGEGICFTAKKAKVLIVDDNHINLKVARGLMQPYHMEISTVQSGKEAIEIKIVIP